MEKIYSPYTQEVLDEVEYMNLNDIEASFQTTLNAQKMWSQTSKEERKSIVIKFNQLLLQDKMEIGKKISTYMGRPIRYSFKEVETGVARSEQVLAFYENLSFIENLDTQRTIVQKPLGNILVFGAWNYPILTAINSIIPAILAGNSVSFRPSLQTFFIGDVFKSAFKKAGLPDFVFQVTPFSHEETKSVVQSKLIHKIVYTGSTHGGRQIHSWAGGNFIPVTMELGGKDAAYVREDADIKNAAINIADGAFFNSGQSCCGVERIYVHQSVYEKFLLELIQEGKNLVLGNPLDQETTLGPMAKNSAVKFLIEQLENAKKAGAKTHLDDLGELNPSGQFIRPEILTDVLNDFSIQQEETFGPFVTVIPVTSDQEAINLINDSKFGLTASIWTNDALRAADLASDIEVGVVMINRCDYVDPKVPWRGEKETGMGQALGPNCFFEYLKSRSMLQN